MKFELWQIDKTKDRDIEDAVQKLLKRIHPLHPLAIRTIKISRTKRLSPPLIKNHQGRAILDLLDPSDYLILLDEKGIQWDSKAFADQIEQWRDLPIRRGIFLIGGAYGFSPEIYERAQRILSLSPMTFSHQLIRLIFMEQLYRAFSILNHLPYHNE